MVRWLREAADLPEAKTFRGRLRKMRDDDPVDMTSLRPAQGPAIVNLEASLALDRPRAMIQMATGSGKTFTACNEAWRLVRLAGAHRILFLVDRGNLGKQALGEFERFRVPGDGRKFTELFNVQLLKSNQIDPSARVVVCTIQRLYSILRGEETFDDELDETGGENALNVTDLEVTYNAALPPETFDIVIVDECHRSIYGVWSQVLDYFDAHIVGLTATPSKQSIGYFKQNLVYEYTHEQAVADNVNVDFDVYQIRTKIGTEGGKVEKGNWLTVRDRATRAKRLTLIEDDLEYDVNDLDRNVVAEDQIRTVVKHFKEVFGTTLFPGRTTVPKTLIFAKDDSHADDIVRIVREEFGKGNEFCEKITYRTTGEKPEDLLAKFRTSTNPRIVVTVDMIATGTDVKPLECLIFMRSVKSKLFFEQMKGRGVRTVSDAELQGVSPGATTKTRFVLIDAVGVTDVEMGEARPLERCKSQSLKQLFEKVATGNRSVDIVSSIASRLNRLAKESSDSDLAELKDLAEGTDLASLASKLILSVDIDLAYAEAEKEAGGEPTDEQVDAVRARRVEEAVKALAANPKLRTRILEVHSSNAQTIDHVSSDEIVKAGFSTDAKARAAKTVNDWVAFIEQNRDEITALEILYSKPHGKRLTFTEIRELANAVSREPSLGSPDRLWEAYKTLEASKVRGSGTRVLTDLVSLVRYAIQDEDELIPWSDTINARYDAWLAEQAASGTSFSPYQRQWLELMKDQVAGSLTIGFEDLLDAPFSQHGGLAKAREVFGEQLDELLEQLTAVLVV
jgi:type I restriction enzyme R subunit